MIFGGCLSFHASCFYLYPACAFIYRPTFLFIRPAFIYIRLAFLYIRPTFLYIRVRAQIRSLLMVFPPPSQCLLSHLSASAHSQPRECALTGPRVRTRKPESAHSQTRASAVAAEPRAVRAFSVVCLAYPMTRVSDNSGCDSFIYQPQCPILRYYYIFSLPNLNYCLLHIVNYQ